MDTLFQTGDQGTMFITRNGLDAMMKLLTLPSLPLTFSSTPTAISIAMALRSLSALNPPAVLKAVITSMGSHFAALDEARHWREGELFIADKGKGNSARRTQG